MALSTGTKLGPYEIQSPLGAGGMGEVYRARDTKLKREVALKVLPEAVAKDGERMARFEREAQLLASLNHPNIATIHGLEESSGVRALVMELVEGPTMAERIARGPIPVDEVLPIAKQIAEALEYAHEKGIIHRDLKPANVKVTAGGSVRVLDFGLAKALEAEAPPEDISNSPTLSAAATKAGVLLGTAAYMSPEQARGKAADRRADIWAYGCLLFEMLSGRRAFSGETVSDTLAGVLRAEPNWSALPPETPLRIRELLRRCLEKDPKLRLQAIGEARIAIEEARAHPEPEREAYAVVPTAASLRRARRLPWAVAAICLALAVGLGWRLLRRTEGTQPVIRFRMSLPPSEATAGTASTVAISPDGSRIVFVARAPASSVRTPPAQSSGAQGPPQGFAAMFPANTELYLRILDNLDPAPIPGTLGASAPFFSPDGQWIAFFADSKLKKVSVAGGVPLTLCDAPLSGGGAWARDDTIIFNPELRSGLESVPAGGGTPQVFSKLAADGTETSHLWPEVLPGGRAVLFTTVSSVFGARSANVDVISRRSGERRTLLKDAEHARYSPAGRLLLFVRKGALMAAPFDPDQLQLTGEPTTVAEGVKRSSFFGAANFSVAQNGTLIYEPEGAAAAEAGLLQADRKGLTRPLSAAHRAFEDLSLSPDGRWLATTIEGAPGGIWLLDLRRDVLTSFAPAAGDPIWTPDGKRIVYNAVEAGKATINWKPADSSAPPETLGTADELIVTDSISPDGKLLAYTNLTRSLNSLGIWVLPLEGERKPRPLFPNAAGEIEARFSPDGKWVAYVSGESGRMEVYVQAFPGPGERLQVSTDGGRHALWSRDGGELFYMEGQRLMAVEVSRKPKFSLGKPHLLFESPIRPSFRGYDVTPDGRGFILIRQDEQQSSAAELDVILNWPEELKRLAPAGKSP